jgi:prevent-host-death family protein
MKIVPLSEAKARLSHYAQLCSDEPVVVTVNGKPAFQLVPVRQQQDLIDQLIAEHPRFRAHLRKRLHESSITAGQALRRIGNKRVTRASTQRRLGESGPKM